MQIQQSNGSNHKERGRWLINEISAYREGSNDEKNEDEWKKSIEYQPLVWPVLLAQVLSCPQLSFPSKPRFFEIYLNFQWQKSLHNQSLPHFESKSYQINFIKSCSSRSFQQHQRHIPIPPKFSAII
jgi:hypothetical protein